MSFVAFPARNPGNPPAPFRPFPAGTLAFYLVGVATSDGLPAPGAQLSVKSTTRKGSGRNPVDTVTEEAKAWRGRRRVVVARREYSWPRYTKGAKAAAREAAIWTGTDGGVMVLWSNLVSVDDAEALGYRTPRARTTARPGRRGTGHENNAAATVRGSRLAALTAEEERSQAVRAREYAAERRTRGPVPTPEAPAPESTPEAPAPESVTDWEARRARDMAAVRANAGGDGGAIRMAAVLLDVFDPAPKAPAAPEDPEDDPSVARFRMLDLD